VWAAELFGQPRCFISARAACPKQGAGGSSWPCPSVGGASYPRRRCYSLAGVKCLSKRRKAYQATTGCERSISFADWTPRGPKSQLRRGTKKTQSWSIGAARGLPRNLTAPRFSQSVLGNFLGTLPSPHFNLRARTQFPLPHRARCCPNGLCPMPPHAAEALLLRGQSVPSGPNGDHAELLRGDLAQQILGTSVSDFG
jgi:hypothetical protein